MKARLSVLPIKLDFSELKPQAASEVPLLDRDKEAPNISLKFLHLSPSMEKLMGTGGSTIQKISAADNCEPFVSPWGSFHPAAVSSQGSTVECFAKTRESLSNSLVAVLETMFAENRKSAYLQFVLLKKGYAWSSLHF
jgi:hypothetical protein